MPFLPSFSHMESTPTSLLNTFYEIVATSQCSWNLLNSVILKHCLTNLSNRNCSAFTLRFCQAAAVPPNLAAELLKLRFFSKTIDSLKGTGFIFEWNPAVLIYGRVTDKQATAGQRSLAWWKEIKRNRWSGNTCESSDSLALQDHQILCISKWNKLTFLAPPKSGCHLLQDPDHHYRSILLSL